MANDREQGNGITIVFERSLINCRRDVHSRPELPLPIPALTFPSRDPSNVVLQLVHRVGLQPAEFHSNTDGDNGFKELMKLSEVFTSTSRSLFLYCLVKRCQTNMKKTR